MNGFVDSKDLFLNANGDPEVVSGLNGLTLGRKSRISDADTPLFKIGISFEYLSSVYEFTVNKSPAFPLATLKLSKITSNFFEGIADFSFLIICE